MRLFVSYVVATCMAVGCASGASQMAAAPAPSEPDTTVGSGDTFEVRVYGEDELSGKYRVGGDGTIAFPFVGHIEVEGKEPHEIAELIRNHLREEEILKNPQVTVMVEEYASKRISVVGSVQDPGTFPMAQGLTVVHAISLAGGFTALASRNDVIVTRRVDGKLERYKVPVQEVTEGQVDDFALRAGDIVYVPERMF